VQKIDPIAFAERFSREEALYSDRYYHFLATLNAHICPTHVIGIGDHVYIPYFADNQYMCRTSPFPGITAFIIDMTIPDRSSNSGDMQARPHDASLK
jgi:hypothetical protein